MSGRWAIGLFVIILVAATVITYVAMGLIFYHEQWQFMLNPSTAVTVAPRVPYTEVRFGSAHLDGWWIPAASDARWSRGTVLYLHSGDGSLSNAVNNLDALHALGINVFAFDYRGYGKSAAPGVFPSEASMTTDADAAWTYLTDKRGLAASTIVLYGRGVGASLAADLAAKHASAGVVLDAPNKSEEEVVQHKDHDGLLPMHRMLIDNFDPKQTLQALAVPKLFLDRNEAQTHTEALYHAAAEPKQYSELKQSTDYAAVLSRFLGSVLKGSGATPRG